MAEAESREKVWNLLLEEARKRGVQKAGLEAVTLGGAWEGEISSKISVFLPSESARLKEDRYAASSQASTTEDLAAVSEVIQPPASAGASAQAQVPPLEPQAQGEPAQGGPPQAPTPEDINTALDLFAQAGVPSLRGVVEDLDALAAELTKLGVEI